MKKDHLRFLGYKLNASASIITIQLTGVHCFPKHNFCLDSTDDRERLNLISSYYLGVNTSFNYMEGKLVKVYFDKKDQIFAIGHPTEDRWIPLTTARVMEFSEEELISFYKSQT